MDHITNLFSMLVKEDQFVKAFFIHGSYVTQETTKENYREYKFYKKNVFIFSFFELHEMNPDIDVIYISSHVEESKIHIQKFFQAHHLSDYFTTINLVSDSVFLNDITSTAPMAMKRILQFRPIQIICGHEYISKMKKYALSNKTKTDVALQNSYDLRKKYLRSCAQQRQQCVLLDTNQYSKKFSVFYKFMLGEIDGGFPQNRIKLVFPSEMNLKAVIKLEDCTVTYLE